MKSLVSFYSVMGSDTLLYHYTSFETLAAYIMPSRNLQLSPLGKSRDAIESMNFFCSNAEWGAEDISERINEEIRNHIKIICFSQDSRRDSKKEKPGMMLARMWSQYGENHRGVCLVFAKDALLQSFEQRFPDKRSRLVQDVRYNQIPFASASLVRSASITLENSNGQLKTMMNEFPDLLQAQVIKDIIFSKMSDFRDENEYRFAYYDNAGDSPQYFPFHSALKAIILGAKISTVQEDIIKEICKSLILPDPVILFKEQFESRRQISKYNIHDPQTPPYIGLQRIYW